MEISEDKSNQREDAVTKKIAELTGKLEEMTAKAEKFEGQAAELDKNQDELEGKIINKKYPCVKEFHASEHFQNHIFLLPYSY